MDIDGIKYYYVEVKNKITDVKSHTFLRAFNLPGVIEQAVEYMAYIASAEHGFEITATEAVSLGWTFSIHEVSKEEYYECDLAYIQHLEAYNNIVSVEELTEACDTLLEE